MNNSGVVIHLHVHDEGISGLNNLVVAVVGIRKHGRPRCGKRQALILKPRIFSARGVLLRFDSAALDLGRRGRERGNAAVERVGHDGGSEGLDGAGAELAEERVVSTGADVFRAGLGRTLLVVSSDLALPLGGFVGSKKGFVLELPGAFERRGSGGVPDAVESGVGGTAGGLTRDERGNEAQRGQDPKQE